MNSGFSDLEIVEKVITGNQKLFNELVVRHKDYACTIAYRIVNNHEDAEEIAHDSFVKAYTSLKYFNRTAKFTTWLYRIVFNTAVSHARKMKLRTQDLDEQTLNIGGTYTSEIEKKDRVTYLEKGIAQLLPVDATVITLFYMKEQSLEEIAQITGLKASLVKVKLHRARKRLATQLTTLLHHEAAVL